MWERRYRMWRFGGAAIAVIAALVLLGTSAGDLVVVAVAGYIVGGELLDRRVRRGHYR